MSTRKFRRKKLFGATGKFPRGKVRGREDEGEIQFGISDKDGEVILDFGKPVAWLGIPPDQVRSLCRALLKRADRCEGVTEEMEAKAQEIADEAHTIELDLTEAAGGGKIVVMRDEDKVSIAHRDTLLDDWPAPIAFAAGRMLMHMAQVIDPSLEGQL